MSQAWVQDQDDPDLFKNRITKNGDKALLDGDGHRADGAMATHRKTAGSFDKQHTDIAILPRWRIQDAARHLVMTARFEHQALADPIVVRDKIRAAGKHGCTL